MVSDLPKVTQLLSGGTSLQIRYSGDLEHSSVRGIWALTEVSTCVIWIGDKSEQIRVLQYLGLPRARYCEECLTLGEYSVSIFPLVSLKCSYERCQLKLQELPKTLLRLQLLDWKCSDAPVGWGPEKSRF